MSLQFDKDLTEPTARLALAAPREWEAFCVAFRQYAATRAQQLVVASLDELQKTQGRAQSCNQLIALFSDSIAAANANAARAGAPARKT